MWSHSVFSHLELKIFYPFPQESFDLQEFAVVFHRLLSWSIWNVGLHNCQSRTTQFWEHVLKNTMKLCFISNFETENWWYQVNKHKHTFCFIKTGNIAALTREQKKNTVSNNSFIIQALKQSAKSTRKTKPWLNLSFLFSVFRFWQLQGGEAPCNSAEGWQSLFLSQGHMQLLGCLNEVKMGFNQALH